MKVFTKMINKHIIFSNEKNTLNYNKYDDLDSVIIYYLEHDNIKHIIKKSTNAKSFSFVNVYIGAGGLRN